MDPAPALPEWLNNPNHENRIRALVVQDEAHIVSLCFEADGPELDEARPTDPFHAVQLINNLRENRRFGLILDDKINSSPARTTPTGGQPYNPVWAMCFKCADGGFTIKANAGTRFVMKIEAADVASFIASGMTSEYDDEDGAVLNAHDQGLPLP
eukprot:jgi/Tetstr1/445856/TSEL_033496.t1